MALGCYWFWLRKWRRPLWKHFNSRMTWHLLIYVHCLRVGHLGHVCTCVCFRRGWGEWVIVIFSVRGDRANLICGAHHCLQSTANKADSYPPEELFVCSRTPAFCVLSALTDRDDWILLFRANYHSTRPQFYNAPLQTLFPQAIPMPSITKTEKVFHVKMEWIAFPQANWKAETLFLFLSHL